METTNQFSYIYDNIALYQYNFYTDWVICLFALLLGALLMLVSYSVIKITALRSIVYTTEHALIQKKKTLSNLILMKDIQTELEKEIEQAILKAAFHS